MTPPVIHLFRRDLRLSDNTALRAALATGQPVIPLFIFDPAILKGERFGLPRLLFMLKGLAALDESLRPFGTRLLIRHGNPLDVLPALLAETGATTVYFNRDYTPYAVRRDSELERRVPVQSYDDNLLHAPGDVLKADKQPYTVFTPFKNAWLKLPKAAPATGAIKHKQFHTLDGLDAPPLPTLRDLGYGETIDVPEAGEKIARVRLQRFLDGSIYEYIDRRNRLEINPFTTDDPTTSGLSPYLRFGMLSARQAYHGAAEAAANAPSATTQKSVEGWISELAWRDFYNHILYHFPHVYNQPFKPEYAALPYRDDPAGFEAFKRGETGYPVVDAAIRQMISIGWMHNRARMIVASFLTKDLFIHWRAGDVFFMNHLIDGDPAANNGGWQWAAGTGTDAQPFFRVFNPVSQSQQFDPSGDYIRHYVHELRGLSAKDIHAPWELSNPPRNYPAPIVDHAFARERAIAAFKSVRAETP
jgi:deoxyribodipyrimidine photo-lyase